MSVLYVFLNILCEENKSGYRSTTAANDGSMHTEEAGNTSLGILHIYQINSHTRIVYLNMLINKYLSQPFD